MKVVVTTFNQEKALVGAFSVITNLRIAFVESLVLTHASLQREVVLSEAVIDQDAGAGDGGEN